MYSAEVLSEAFGLQPGEKHKHAVVLGRLFKIHPVFAAAVADILIATRNGSSDGSTVSVVFVSESVWEWNEAIFSNVATALRSRMMIGDIDKASADHSSAVAACLARLRFAHYHLYVDLLLSATVVLDTFPYGGKLP